MFNRSEWIKDHETGRGIRSRDFSNAARVAAASFALRSNGTYGCGWHRDRGPDVCASTLAVRRRALEARIFDAIRDRVLTPENVHYTIERALGIVREALD